MDKNKKNKKPLRLSNEGRLQLRKNLGPDQVKRPSGKKSKTIQIIFKKKSPKKHEGGFKRKPIFEKQQVNKFDKSKSFDTNNENFVGIFREKSKSSYFKPENDILNNYWFKLEDNDLEKYTGLTF